jgi:hypothetical protein
MLASVPMESPLFTRTHHAVGAPSFRGFRERVGFDSVHRTKSDFRFTTTIAQRLFLHNSGDGSDQYLPSGRRGRQVKIEGDRNPPFASMVRDVSLDNFAGRKGWGTHSMVREVRGARRLGYSAFHTSPQRMTGMHEYTDSAIPQRRRRIAKLAHREPVVMAFRTIAGGQLGRFMHSSQPSTSVSQFQADEL